MCSYDLFFGLILKAVVSSAQRCEMHLCRVPHVMVRISSLHLIEYCECLLELILNELVLGLESVIILEMRVNLLDSLNLVDRKR